MKALTAQPGLLAAKFDRMASKYAVWTVGNLLRLDRAIGARRDR